MARDPGGQTGSGQTLAAGGVNTFQDQWPAGQPAYHSGQAYAIGAETGPLGLCYRPRLL